MSTVPSGQRIDPVTLDFRALPADCFAAIISLTSPLDACRLSLVSTFFNSVASSDAVWVKFLPADYQNLFPASHSVSSLKDLYLNLCDHPVLIEDGKKFFTQQELFVGQKKWGKSYMLAPRNLAITWGDTPRVIGRGSPDPIPGFLRLRSFLLSVGSKSLGGLIVAIFPR
ncbi:hypothetical protein SLEP1_g14933 [Rubroshorea leprosula]|uniref:F-box domain-containing protein n=1 Tax=Rubroshorea leprosula TaxID=152421 RepID=A0AAV5IQ42_9ROSI|nr:hypothetical protein SLEP1_g14933 [Rubroshorea leprosula]